MSPTQNPTYHYQQLFTQWILKVGHKNFEMTVLPDMQKDYFRPGNKFWLKNVRTIDLDKFFELRVLKVNIRVCNI